VPWKRRLGYASSALRRILPEARVIGLPYVEVTMDVDNLASQHVVLANGGVLVETFTKPAAFGSTTALRFRIDLARPTANLKSTVGQ
jgi:predicted acetyltransferase